jgi:hypothetical protein
VGLHCRDGERAEELAEAIRRLMESLTPLWSDVRTNGAYVGMYAVFRDLGLAREFEGKVVGLALSLGCSWISTWVWERREPCPEAEEARSPEEMIRRYAEHCLKLIASACNPNVLEQL